MTHRYPYRRDPQTGLTTAVLGNVRVRQTGYEFVVEEYRWSGWHIIEALFSWEQAKQAAKEYKCEII